MNSVILTIIIIASIILFLIILYVVIITIVKKSQLKKMYSDVEAFLDFYTTENIGSFEKKFLPEYDYILRTKKNQYFIKVIPNFSNQEITVNNSVKWQLRKAFNDESLRYVENVEPLMRMDMPNNDGKLLNKKVYIIYPNAKSLLKYINECEMEFVHPDTDVYGTNIITYVYLNENKETLDL